jgi:RNA polymerase sigma-70 factor, ECF subfamily
VLHCLPLPALRGRHLELYNFDAAYVLRLRAGDSGTLNHFTGYFGPLIDAMLRTRLKCREDMEDVRQETFTQFLIALQHDRILYPERLGGYVVKICKNILCKKYREQHREDELNMVPLDDTHVEIPSPSESALQRLTAQEAKELVNKVLEELGHKDQKVLRAVIFDERDKDDVCREFGVTRVYLRVLLHRAIHSFKDKFPS